MKIIIFDNNINYHPFQDSKKIYNIYLGALSIKYKIYFLIKERFNIKLSDIIYINNYDPPSSYPYIENFCIINISYINYIVANFSLIDNNKIIYNKINNDLVLAIIYDGYINLSNILTGLFIENNSIENLIKKYNNCLIGINTEYFKYIYNFIEFNSNHIISDFKYLINNSCINKRNIKGNIYISPSSKLTENVILDSSSGPIFINDYAVISNSTIIGPTYIGKNTIIKNAVIEKSSIFNYCKLSGEISNSIFCDYVNKQHYGYIGYSYIGNFVNLGAGVTNSDLKNNYSNIYFPISENNIINSNMTKLGVFIGDYTNVGISCNMYSGTIIGFGCNIYGSSFINKKYIVPFSWGGCNDKYQIYDIYKFIDTYKKVLPRRNLYITSSHINLFFYIYKLYHY